MGVLSCGVSQGNKFGPIILISLINDAFENAVTHTFKSVDDLSLTGVGPANLPSNIDTNVDPV